MPESIETRYDELQDVLKMLKRENALLAERTKEVFLLSLVSEAVAGATITREILNRSLERISILKDISFSACCAVSGGRTSIVHSWSNFGSTPDDVVVLSPALLDMVSTGPLVLDIGEFAGHGGVLTISTPMMKPSSILLIPCTTLEHGNCIFLYADARRSKNELTLLRFLFAGIVDLTVARLDSMAFKHEQSLAEQKLEHQVEERTTALNESLMQYKNLFDNTPDAFFLIEVEGRDAGKILQVNQAAAELHGYRPEEMRGMNLFDIEIVDPSIGIQQQMDLLFTGKTIYIETVRKHKSGSHFTVESVRKSVETQGKMYVLSFDRDITGRRRAQEDVQQARKMESLGIFAGGIAHDFNNILQGIVGYTSLMLLKSTTDPSVKQNVEAIAASADRAGQLTKQLLSYAGSARFQMRPLNLNAMIRENQQLLKAQIPNAVKFVSNLHDPLPEINADYAHLQEAIMNCVTNAVEAIGDNSGTVAIETAVREMTRDLIARWRWSSGPLAPGMYILLSISDSGCGMEETMLAKIFDPFFTTKFTGRGLGLAAVLGIVRGHQGGIAVESQPGKGTRFLIALPVIDGGKSNGTPEVALGEPLDIAIPVEKESSPRVLLIDDEINVRELISDILESVSVNVTQASDGMDGIAAYAREQHKIDLVMLDLSMPGMSGDQVFHKLREINPNVKVILSSGYSEDDVQKQYSMVHVDGYLQKPFTTRTLISKIQSCLQHKG
jgi:two-component system, cell cycle sensor histidine kinase and response regulator CckA